MHAVTAKYRYKLFVVAGCQGAGTGDAALILAMQMLYSEMEFFFEGEVNGFAYEIDEGAIEMSKRLERVEGALKFKQRGDLRNWVSDASNLVIGDHTVVLAYAGPPCEKVSWGAWYSHDSETFVGPHAHRVTWCMCGRKVW